MHTMNNMNGYPSFESHATHNSFQGSAQNQAVNVNGQYNSSRFMGTTDFDLPSSSAATPTSYSSNNLNMQSTSIGMHTNMNWSTQNHKQRPPGGSGVLLNGHMISPYSTTVSSVGAATAAANLSSLANVTTTLADESESANSPVSYSSQSNPRSTQQIMYSNTNGSAFSPAVPPNNSHPTYPGTGNHLQSTDSRAPNTTQPADQLMRLQRELEKERGMRCQLQQRVIELTQRCHSQQLVEKSYEELSMKYTHAYTQLQKMGLVMERYGSMIKQLEQENRLLAAENSSLKAQENVVQDKTMLYNMLMERSKKLEEENSSLVLENENYQRQYEKTIDEISNNVVQALLAQKTLQEQCLQLQDRLNELERDSVEGGEAVRQARQASSDSRLIWTYRGGRTRPHTASPSADSVRSMPAQHLYWRQGSIGSLEHQQTQQHTGNAASNDSGEPSKEQIPEHNASNTANGQHNPDSESKQQQFVCVETEFPANNSSPKSTRCSLDRHPSSGSLDSAYHSRGFVKYNGHDVRCQRSVSAEALKDMKVNMRRNIDLTLPTSITTAVLNANTQSSKQTVKVDVHNDLSPDKPQAANQIAPHSKSAILDSGVVNDPFAEDADDILSKHQSLIVGSMEDIFSTLNGDLKNDVIQEEDSTVESSAKSGDDGNNTPPTPPPRPRSRCLSECSLTVDSKSSHEHHLPSRGGEESGTTAPPPLPPKQYKGSRRPYKPLPAEPDEPTYIQDEELDSSDKNTDSESIKQEINALTSKIARMAAASAYHK